MSWQPMQYTFEKLKAIFEADAGIKLKIISGSLGKLMAQIENGVPFDIFLSAKAFNPIILKLGPGDSL